METTQHQHLSAKLAIIQAYSTLLDRYIAYLDREKSRGKALDTIVAESSSTTEDLRTLKIDDVSANVVVTFNWKLYSNNYIVKFKTELTSDKDNKFSSLLEGSSPYVTTLERRSTSAERALLNIQDDLNSALALIKDSYTNK